MPELPEVETVRRRLDRSLRGKKITEVHADEADRFLFASTPFPELKRLLLGARVRGSGRKGKYFWLELDRKPWPLFHLGMTGNVEIRAGQAGGRAGSKQRKKERAWGGLRLWSSPAEKGEERSWFCRLLLGAEDGTEIALLDPRRFGRVWLTPSPLLHPRVKKLGFDPLLDFPNAAELRLLLQKRKAPIKAVLLDQKLFAGVGNWIADEILYQAKISPLRAAASLSQAEVSRLRQKTLAIVKKAVAVSADYERFPSTWLFHHRWGKNTQARTGRKEKIIHQEIGGRTTAWVPSVQK